MRWPEFLGLQNAWLLGLLAPLVILYFLKLKRPRLDIPSLALWRSVLNDQRVNSPFQRFRRNLLLLLQVLLLISLALAAMQPIFSSGSDRAEYLPVLIDCSASMAALDGPRGTSRLDAAKQEVRKLIENLLPRQRISLIAVSSTARRLTDFSDNKRVLRDALEQLQVSPVASQLEDALRMTQALARTVKVETVVLYTDGNVPAIVDFELPFKLNFQKLPVPGQNLGITALNARRTRDRWDVFVRIEASGGTPGADNSSAPNSGTGGEEASTTETAPSTGPVLGATVQLLQKGKEPASEIISVEPGRSQRIVFHVDAAGASALEVRLQPADFDSLASDNVGWLDLPAGRPLAVYCPVDLTSYRHALSGLSEVILYPEDDGTGTTGSYDLVISDKPGDVGLEAGAFLFTGFVPDDLKNLVRIDASLAEVVDWQRSAALLQHVLLTEVQIAEQPVAGDEVRDRDFEELGYDVLAHGRRGPLVLKKDIGGRPQHFLLFHTDRSTLPYRVAFPILVANAVQIAMQQAGLSDVRGQTTGVLAPLALKPDTEYTVRGPDGKTQEARSNAEGLLTGVAVPEVGRYSILEGGREVHALGVSLLAPTESSLQTVDQLQFSEVSVSAAAELLKSDRPIWPWLAGFGFVVLLGEWWLFQKRPSGLPA